MARVMSMGFELQSATAGIEVLTVTGTPTIDTTTKRSVAASMRFNAAGSEVSAKLTDYSGGIDGHYRCYLRFASFPASLTKVIQIQDLGGDHTSIRINSDGTLELWIDSGTPAQSGVDSSALSLDTWYRIELRVGTFAGDAVIARIDGSD